jgi:hypothetical protein
VSRSSSHWRQREVEVQRVEQVDRRARGVDGHLRWNLQQRLGVVEDDLHAGVDEVVGERLGRRRGTASTATTISSSSTTAELVVVAHGQRRLELPTLSSSTSNSATTRNPWSAKMSEVAIAVPRWPAPNSAMLCWPEVCRILRICSTSESML